MDSNKLKTYPNLLGLIGYPLSHSFSKGYFSEKFERENIEGFYYENFPLSAIEELPGLIRRFPNLIGLNVTIPYKEAVFPYLDRLDAGARKIGAVNTIKRMADGRLMGYNTDVYGFESSLKKKIKTAGLEVRSALVLGTGGAAKAVYYALDQLRIRYQTVSRDPARGDLTYEELSSSLLAAHQLIVNTTPLGMAPKIDTYPRLPYEALTSRHLLYDLVYNPGKTLFLRKGEDAGAAIINGLEMLHLQAEKAWEIWSSV